MTEWAHCQRKFAFLFDRIGFVKFNTEGAVEKVLNSPAEELILDGRYAYYVFLCAADPEALTNMWVAMT